MLRCRTLLALGLTTVALPSGAAQAADHCVTPAASCVPQKTYATVQAALDGAFATPGADRVLLPAGTFTAPTTAGFAYEHDGARVEIVGAGRNVTTLTAPTGASRVLGLDAGAAGTRISDVRVLLPNNTADGAGGLEIRGDVARVTVTRGATQTWASTGIRHEGGAIDDTSVVLSPQQSNDAGLSITGQDRVAVVSDTVVEARIALRASQTTDVTVERSRLSGAGRGAVTYGGTLRLRNSLLRLSGTSIGVAAETQTAQNALVQADHLTIVGATGTALSASNSLGTGSEHATLTVRNSVVRGFDRAIVRDGQGSGSASVTTAFSDYDAGGARVVSTGPGQLVESERTFVGDAGFAGPSDFRLTAGSKLVDAGELVVPAAGALDLAGQPRLRDGDGDCAARRDIGAFELQADSPASCTAGPTPVPAPAPAPAAAAALPAAAPASAQGTARAVAARDLLAPRIGRPAVKRLAGGKVRVRFTLSEAATVTVKVGTATRRLRAKAGTVTVRVRARRGRVTVAAVDAAGNRAERRAPR